MTWRQVCAEARFSWFVMRRLPRALWEVAKVLPSFWRAEELSEALTQAENFADDEAPSFQHSNTTATPRKGEK